MVNSLLVKILHHLTQHFKEHAVLKGDVELSLFSSLRSTNDLDFIFVPFESKKDIVHEVQACLHKMSKDISVEVNLSSKNAKFYVKQGFAQAEVEISVAMEIESIPMNTLAIARPHNLPPQVVRIMKPEIAFAHKIAAWNERRLLRDVYDMYFWFSVQNILPDINILKQRLSKVESRIPKLRHRKSINIEDLCEELRIYCAEIDQKSIDQELSGIPTEERQNLAPVLQSQINLLIVKLSANV